MRTQPSKALGCGCGGAAATVTKYRVRTAEGNKDFLTLPEADTYRRDNGITLPVRPVQVKK